MSISNQRTSLNNFQGECKLDSDCFAQFNTDYKCFLDKQQCYYCSPNYLDYKCEGDGCRTDKNCALGMCTNNICAYQDSMFWTIILYIIIGLVSLAICIVCAVCGEIWWKGYKKRQKEKSQEKQAMNSKSSQVLMQIFEAIKQNNGFPQILLQSITENLTITELDYFQNQTLIDVTKPIEYMTQSLEMYVSHVSNSYGTIQKAYVKTCGNYYTGESVLASIIKKTHMGQKVEYQITAKFIDKKLYNMEVVIVPLLSYWQQQKKFAPIYKQMETKYRFANVYPHYDPPKTNNNFDDIAKRSEEEKIRGAIQREQEEAAKRNYEYERQQQQFKENMRKQEQDYYYYYRK